ncbi:mitochondrial cytochrome c oxidase subunit VIa [Schizophyllum commune Tattone D]|nr:mitochondrial cytochrome c oxidase subunit VIa [Schizophyllum commune Loenen D]KAI5836162.1 mitochondrial cytochrome c oxidase subunit VIa [Schizophyllum commune Tattone D]
MSLLARNVARSSLRAARPMGRRGYLTPNPEAAEQFVARQKAVEQHAAETTDLWRKVSFYVCIPAMLLCGAYVYKKETDHLAHLEHLRHENDGVLPQPPEYEYLNMRRKPYPWGKNSLFFNPEVQKNLEEE